MVGPPPALLLCRWPAGVQAVGPATCGGPGHSKRSPRSVDTGEDRYGRGEMTCPSIVSSAPAPMSGTCRRSRRWGLPCSARKRRCVVAHVLAYGRDGMDSSLPTIRRLRPRRCTGAGNIADVCPHRAKQDQFNFGDSSRRVPDAIFST